MQWNETKHWPLRKSIMGYAGRIFQEGSLIIHPSIFFLLISESFITLTVEIHRVKKIFVFNGNQTSTGPYRSCAALLAIANPLILILVWSSLFCRIWTFEFVWGQDGTNWQTTSLGCLGLIWFGLGCLGIIWYSQLLLGLVWFGWDSYSHVCNLDGTYWQKNKKTLWHVELLHD